MMKVQKIILLICFILFVGSSAIAQLTVKVQIIDNEKKEAIPFATIVIGSNQVGVQSDDNGCFSLACSPMESVLVRCIGYRQKTVIASDVFDKKLIELQPDTIWLGEVTVFAKSAYKMLLQARDSTNKYQRKSMVGTCKRQDRLSLNKKTERKSDAIINFEVMNIKNGHNDTDYWLESLKAESFSKLSKQPYLAYPSTIPLNLFSSKWPSEEELSEMKCIVASNNDGQLIIKITKAKPNKNIINQATYFINKNNWIIEGIEYEGNFKASPIKKSNRYHYQTNIHLTYDMLDDSCSLSRFYYKMVFSHKKIDKNNLWEYLVNMEISANKSGTSSPKGTKLHRLDYLLFKDGDKNIK
jgi:hypothetical protein